MTDKLEIFNLSLLHIRESSLVSLTEPREARYNLDTVYPSTVQEMLEAGFWKFAMRSAQIDANPDRIPAFGQAHVFDKPEDWVKTYDVSYSEMFNPPAENWIEETEVWFSDVSPIYVRYVSNSDTGYGMDMSVWTARFIKALTFELAWRIAPKATGASDNFLVLLDKNRRDALVSAKSFEAMREPNRRPPEGRWNQARYGMRGRSDWWRITG